MVPLEILQDSRKQSRVDKTCISRSEHFTLRYVPWSAVFEVHRDVLDLYRAEEEMGKEARAGQVREAQTPKRACKTKWAGRELIRPKKLGKGAVVHANLVIELEGEERREEAMTISINHRAATTRSSSL